MKFHDIVNLICEQSPLQKKKLTGYLSEQTDRFFCEADEFALRYNGFLQTRNIPIEYAVDAYLRMCGNMLRCQVAFLRSGRYPVASTQEARNDVYHSHAEMLPYMVGLGISQFLWPSHYRIFNFFKQAILERADYVSDYLEIGPGHGLLLENALTTLHGLQKAVAVDISPTSLDLTKDFIEYAIPGDRRVRFILGDIMEVDLGQGFHFITMGEVLEHVDRPTQLLERLRGLLAPDGRIFISTCANCPAIDHVYQFDRIQQIRDLILDAGFKIERELALPVENMSVEKAEISRVTINYCALLMLP